MARRLTLATVESCTVYPPGRRAGRDGRVIVYPKANQIASPGVPAVLIETHYRGQPERACMPMAANGHQPCR
jgi:hypothetical protein